MSPLEREIGRREVEVSGVFLFKFSVVYMLLGKIRWIKLMM